MNNRAVKLFQSQKTVFSSKDLALLWQETNKNNLKSKMAYYVKRGLLTRISRGIFVKNKEYDPRELATSIYLPSYISFETVLRGAGMIFQYYDTIFVASVLSKTILVDRQRIAFRKLKDAVLYNPRGIENRGSYSIATPERAFLDLIYLFPEYHFDNLRTLDWNRCFELAEIYHNQALFKRLKQYQKLYA